MLRRPVPETAPIVVVAGHAVNGARANAAFFKRAILADVDQPDSRWALAQMSAAEDE